MEPGWVTIEAERALYLDCGQRTILCDRLPSPVTLVIKPAATARDGPPAFADILAAVAGQAGVTEASICARADQGRTKANWPRQRLLLIVRRLRPDLSWRWLGMRMSGRDARCLTDSMKAAARRYDDCEVAEVAAIAAVLKQLGGPGELPEADPRAWMGAHRLDNEIRTAERRVANLRAQRDRLGVRA